MKFFTKSSVLFLAVVMTAVVPARSALAQTGTTPDTGDSISRELARALAELESIEDAVGTIDRAISEERDAVEQLEAELSSGRKGGKTVVRELDGISADADDLEQRLDDASVRLESVTNDLKKIFAQAVRQKDRSLARAAQNGLDQAEAVEASIGDADDALGKLRESIKELRDKAEG